MLSPEQSPQAARHSAVGVAIHDSRPGTPRQSMRDSRLANDVSAKSKDGPDAVENRRGTFNPLWLVLFVVLLIVGGYFAFRCGMSSKAKGPTPMSSEHSSPSDGRIQASVSMESSETIDTGHEELALHRKEVMEARNEWYKNDRNHFGHSRIPKFDASLFPRILYFNKHTKDLTGMYCLVPLSEHEGRYEYVLEGNPHYTIKFSHESHQFDIRGWTMYAGDEIFSSDWNHPQVSKSTLPVDAGFQGSNIYCLDHKLELKGFEDTQYTTERYSDIEVCCGCDVCGEHIANHAERYHCNNCEPYGFDICVTCAETEEGKRLIGMQS